MKKVLYILIIFSNVSLAQVAINTDGSEAKTSAMLEVTSTTKGALLPRMTTVQRNAISSPANGLMVYDLTEHAYFYCQDNTWYNLEEDKGEANTEHYIGEYYDGGIIFHIWDSLGEQHGLIVEMDFSSTGAKWRNSSSTLNNRSTWDGLSNTLAMKNDGNCPAYQAIGSTKFNDGWYLPSIDEIYILFNALYHVNPALQRNGGTEMPLDYIYWTSTEHGYSSAVVFSFGTSYTSSSAGSSGDQSKTSSYYVRAIKRF